MEIKVLQTADELGRACAARVSELLNAAISQNGEARMIVSTGASQFSMFNSLVCQPVDWSRVTMFHLDEYTNMPDTHPASFRKYLRERFIEKLPVPLKKAVWVMGDDSYEALSALGAELNAAPIDVGLIGVGENAHIAFNDPPADFETETPYIVVRLDEACRKQQLGEGWFGSLQEVPETAISMSCRQIMKCKVILSAVPYAVKARAIYNMLANELNPMVPATLLKTHADITLYLDADSAGLAVGDGLIKG
ncbi:MAG: 6-phosphogluconolactonase [Clostridia bacterium]|nr:6-phosphogluconolactonase [Clostridia bacterium]